GPREVSLATALEGGEEPELTLEASEDEEPELLFESARPDAPVEHELVQESVPPPPALPAPMPAPANQPAAAPLRAAARPAPAAASVADEVDPELEEVFEEVSFYLAQGLHDEAREVLNDALNEHPDHPQLVAKLAELDGGGDAAPRRSSVPNLASETED